MAYSHTPCDNLPAEQQVLDSHPAPCGGDQVYLSPLDRLTSRWPLLDNLLNRIPSQGADPRLEPAARIRKHAWIVPGLFPPLLRSSPLVTNTVEFPFIGLSIKGNSTLFSPFPVFGRLFVLPQPRESTSHIGGAF